MSTFSTHISLRIKSIALMLAMIAGVFASCGPQEPEVVVVDVSEVSVSPTTLSLVAGDTANLTATVSPSNATDKTVRWSSSNSLVASVDNGKVTAVAEGSANITATAGGKSATCEVTVSAKIIPVTDISIEQASVSIEVGETTKLTAMVSPFDATNATVTWSSSDQTIATVDNGTVSAIKRERQSLRPRPATSRQLVRLLSRQTRRR